MVEISDEARLMADPPLVELALSNLFSNAVKYGEPPYRIGWRQEEGRGILSVCNCGPPIPESQQPLLFERLYRMDRFRTGDSPGHGLGLALVRSAMLAHAGQVELCSDEQSTCFLLTFPNQPASPDESLAKL